MTINQNLPIDKFDYHPHSFGDQNIRLFRVDGNFCRGIKSERAIFFNTLFDNGVINSLVEKGLLIESERLVNTSLDYHLLVSHRTISFVSYPIEWCIPMFRDAILTLINLAIELSKYGLTLGDAHPWNILFDIEKNKPIFVDLGSLIPIQGSEWGAYGEFCHFCLYPLLLMAEGHDQIARLLMFEDSGVQNSLFTKLIKQPDFFSKKYQPSSAILLKYFLSKTAFVVPESFIKRIKGSFSVVKALFRKSYSQFNLNSVDQLLSGNNLAFFEQLKQTILAIDAKNHHDKASLIDIQRSLPPSSWAKSQHLICQTLSDLKPASVLCLGHNLAKCTKIPANLGIKTLAFSTNQRLISELYHYGLERGLPILPLIMDFTKPTPSRGLGNHWSIPAHERFTCDLVIAIGLVHSIVQQRHLTFDHIAEGFSLFSAKFLLVDFTEFDDPIFKRRFPWFKLVNFLTSLESHFSQIKVVSQLSDKQTFLLCEK